MRVLLLNAPYLDIYGAFKTAVGRYFPLGLGYIAAVLREAGHEVSLIDPEAEGISHDQIGPLLEQKRPDLVGISSATPNFNGAIGLAQMVKKRLQCPVIVGGVHASALPVEILHSVPEFDFAAVGEGEYTMLDLVNCLENGDRGKLPTILGLAYRDSTGQVLVNNPRPSLADLDLLPKPARDLVDLSLYRPHAHNFRHPRSATMLTSRGCPARCSFCASHVVHGRTFRAHSPKYVLSEIKELYHDYGIRHILIQDDTFTVDKNRVHEICDGIIAENIHISWFCFARANTVDEILLIKMKKAGCYSIGVGVESADNAILRTVEKGLTFNKIKEMVLSANRLGFKTQTFYIFGHPGETLKQAKQTIVGAIGLSSHLAFFNMMVPFPGTDIFLKHYSNMDFSSWDKFVAVGTIPIKGVSHLTPAQIQGLVREANMRYYLRLGQVYRMLKGIGSFAEFTEIFRGAMGLAKQLLHMGRDT